MALGLLPQRDHLWLHRSRGGTDLFPSPAGRHCALKEIMSTVDFIGILLMAGSFTSLIIGITWGGTVYAWDSGRIIAALTLGCVGLVLLGLYEAFVVKEGGLDRRLFAESMNFPILLFVCTIDGILLLGVNVALSQEIFDLFTQDAVSIVTMLTPYLALSTFGCIPAGWIMASIKSYKILLVAALLWCSLFTAMSSSVYQLSKHLTQCDFFRLDGSSHLRKKELGLRIFRSIRRAQP